MHSSFPFGTAYAIQWHPDSSEMHLEPLADALRQNTEAYLRGVSPGWYILAIAPTAEEASRLLEQLRDERG